MSDEDDRFSPELTGSASRQSCFNAEEEEAGIGTNEIVD